jgi:hypothetical protein
MLDIARCPECMVPEPFSQGQVWLNNGDIVQKLNPQARIGFTECDNLDPLFRNIGDIIGFSIEQIIVSINARATEVYMRKLITQEMRDMVADRQIDPPTLAEPILAYCHIVGFGKYKFMDYRYEGSKEDYTRYLITKPFSAPLVAGAMAGTMAALLGGEHDATYGEISPGIYEFITSWTKHSKALKEKFPIVLYDRHDGDIELERCATCGSPKAFRDYNWRLDEGLIVNERTGRRMAILGPESLDNLFEALEEELGETIPEVVVEAQRRFTRTGFYALDDYATMEEFRIGLALRGLGNLKELDVRRKGLYMRVENAVLYLMLTGMIQGVFEVAMDVESNVEWAISGDGDLEVEVKPKA